MAKGNRSPKTDACREAACPLLPGQREAGGSGTPSGCERGRNAEPEAVLASTLDPVATIDSWGTIRTAGNSLERVFGCKPGALAGRNVRVLMPEPHGSDDDQCPANYRQTLKTDILGRTREFEAGRRDGTRFATERSVSRADASGQALPVLVGILKDVSERKAVERTLERHRRQLDATARERTRALEQSHEQPRMAERLAAVGTLTAVAGARR